MFNLRDIILSSLLNGFAPFLLLVKDENDIIFGMCSFNYIYRIPYFQPQHTHTKKSSHGLFVIN